MYYEKDVPLTTLARYVVNLPTGAFTKRKLSPYTYTNLRHTNLRDILTLQFVSPL